MQGKICCVTGYREIPDDKLDYVQQELRREIGTALEDGYRRFLAGFIPGVGMYFCRLVDERRGEYPDIFLEVALNPKHCESFSFGVWELLAKSNGIKPLCEECQEGYPLSVTRELVGQSERVIAVCNEPNDSDALFAMDYAHTMERDLRIIKI